MTTPIARSKAQLRSAMRAALSAYPAEDAQAASRIIARLASDAIRSTDGPILSFAPILSAGEVDLCPLHDELIRAGRLALPRIDWERGTMRPMLLPAATALHTDALETRHHRVPEPKQGDPLRLDSLRAVLVPGLAFDSAGRRLGRGAGFYDRFLAGRATAESPIRIGVCFAIQLVDAVPAEPHDLPMNRIITEHGVIRCD